MVVQGTGGSIIQAASIYGVMAPDHRICESPSTGSADQYTGSLHCFQGSCDWVDKALASYWAKKAFV